MSKDIQKDRLIELLKPHVSGTACLCESGSCELTSCRDCKAKRLATHLLANGVIVPPFEIGTKVYVITSQTSNGKNLYIFEDIITHYVVCDNYTLMCFENHIAEANHNWDKIFLTKKEAEAKLKELEK